MKGSSRGEGCPALVGDHPGNSRGSAAFSNRGSVRPTAKMAAAVTPRHERRPRARSTGSAAGCGDEKGGGDTREAEPWGSRWPPHGGDDHEPGRDLADHPGMRGRTVFRTGPPAWRCHNTGIAVSANPERRTSWVAESVATATVVAHALRQARAAGLREDNGPVAPLRPACALTDCPAPAGFPEHSARKTRDSPCDFFPNHGISRIISGFFTGRPACCIHEGTSRTCGIVGRGRIRA